MKKMKEKEFNQADYIKEYNKKHYSYFKAQLKKEEIEELTRYKKKHNISKPEFIRKAIVLFKEQKSKK